jgi:plasmid maintenance system antidote protein VapI
VAEHPGAALKAAILERGWTVHGCALTLLSDGPSLGKVVRGERPISPHLACQLAAARVGPAGLDLALYWLGLQAAFEVARERARMGPELADIEREVARA